MSLTPGNLQKVLIDLDTALAAAHEERTLVVCGGGALLVVDVISRTTQDIDVITPELDPVLKSLAAEVGKRHGLEASWLNNGPASLARDLEAGWRDRTRKIFEGKALLLHSLGHKDLLASKLYALCDREEQDLDDILGMKPFWPEIESLKTWLLDRDGSPLWLERVESRLTLLKKRMRHE